jgi:hypothetical protein
MPTSCKQGNGAQDKERYRAGYAPIQTVARAMLFHLKFLSGDNRPPRGKFPHGALRSTVSWLNLGRRPSLRHRLTDDETSYQR